MHSIELTHRETIKSGVKDAVVNHNGDWSGDAIIAWTELVADNARQQVHEVAREARLPAALLVALGKRAALSFVVSEMIGKLEQLGAENLAHPSVTPPGPREIRVVFDGPPSHESGRFVEVEDPDGNGIAAGRWQQLDKGYWALCFKMIDDRLDSRVRDCADRHLAKGSEAERAGDARAAAELRRVGNLLYALVDGRVGEVVIG